VDDLVPAAGLALNARTAEGGRVRPCLVTVTGHGTHSPSNAEAIATLLDMPLVDEGNIVEAGQ
jgi:hypothetical protein